MTKQDYSLLLGGNSDDDDDDFVLPPVFAGKGKSAGKRARSTNDVRLYRIESRQLELEDQLKRFKQKEDDEIRRINCQLQLSKAQFDSLNGVMMSMKSNIECLICTNGIEDESAVFACCRKLCGYSCISRWLVESNTCPHCRHELTLESLECIPRCDQIDSVLSILRGYQSTGIDNEVIID